MVKKVSKSATVPVPSDSLGLLLLTLADTTWRMMVPSLGLAMLGLKLDLMWQTGPWLTLTGLVIGLWLSVQLVKRQIKATL